MLVVKLTTSQRAARLARLDAAIAGLEQRVGDASAGNAGAPPGLGTARGESENGSATPGSPGQTG